MASEKKSYETVKDITEHHQNNYAQPIHISDTDDRPIIIPLGFDCGPSTFLRGSLDSKTRKEHLPRYKIADLPFDTLVLTKSTPIIQYFKKTLLLSGNNIEKLRSVMLNSYFNDANVKDDSGNIISNILFAHQGSYDNQETFKKDMLIRIKNLLTILSKPDNLQCKIFFRKSHSKCHHHDIDDKYAYKFAAESIDLEDAKDLSLYLQSLGHTNFKIVLYLCCKICYPKNNNNYDGNIIYAFDKHILCVRQLDENNDKTKPYLRTMPKIFGDSAYRLFKHDNTANLITKDTTYDKFSKILDTEPKPEPKKTNAAPALTDTSNPVASRKTAAATVNQSKTLTFTIQPPAAAASAVPKLYPANKHPPASKNVSEKNRSAPKAVNNTVPASEAQPTADKSSICNLISAGSMNGGSMKKKSKTIKKTKNTKTKSKTKKNKNNIKRLQNKKH